jgi:exonuclease III
MLRKRRVDVCCVQETRWKGEGARMSRMQNAKYKIYWKGERKVWWEWLS